MEAAILGILMLGGYHIQSNLNEPDNNFAPKKKGTFSTKNIYESNKVNESYQFMQNKGNENMAKSLDPTNTNIIPTNYNLNTAERQKRVLLDQSRRNNEQYIKSLERFDSLQKMDSLLDSNQANDEKQIITEYFDNINSANKNNQMFDSNQVLNNEDTQNIMLTNSINAVFDDTKQKSHNNMVPYFGSNITQNTDINRYSTSKLEGTNGPQLYKVKREMAAPKPQKDISYTRGAPVTRNTERFLQSAYRPFEKIVEPIRVGPGIDKGYCASGNDGFHNTYRIPHKNVDELRTKNNKKVSYTSKVNSGKHTNDNRTLTQTMRKNRPDTYYEQSQDNYFRTTGSRLKETFHPMIRVHPKKLEGTTDYVGNTGRNPKSKLSHTSTYYTDPTKNEQTSHPPSNIQGAVKRGNNNAKSYIAKTTIRQTTEDNKYTGNIASHNKHTIGPEDELKTTMKEVVLGPTENANLVGASKLYASYEDNAKTTIRQTTQFNDHTGNLSGYNKTIASPEDQFRTTGRQTTQFNEHTGNLSGYNKLTAGPEDDFRTTARQITQYNDHTGNLAGYNKLTAGPDDEFKTTVRQTTQYNDHTGNLAGYNKLTTGPEDDFRTTVRQTTQYNDHTGNLTGYNKTIASPDDEFKTTVRQTTQYNKHTGTLTGNSRQTIKNLDDLKTTMKQITVEYSRDGNVKGGDKSMTRLQDTIRPTQKEDLTDNEYQGILKGNSRQTLPQYDKAKTTQKEQTSDYEYIGDAKGRIRATTLPQDKAKTTQKEQTSDYEYIGDAKGMVKYRSRLAEENTETNEKREIISQGRGNAKQGSKISLDPEKYNININRQEYDECRGHQQRFNRVISNNSGIEQQGQFMFSGNKLENSNSDRIDTSLYDSYRMNELTIRKI